MLHSHKAQEVAFLLATRRGENFRAQMPGYLDGRDPDAARRTVDEQAFAGLELRQMFEGVPGGEKYRGNGGGGLMAPVFGHTRHRMRRRRHMTGKT